MERQQDVSTQDTQRESKQAPSISSAPYRVLPRKGAVDHNKGNDLLFTTCRDVAQFRLKVFIQGEAPGRFLLVPWVAAVGMPPIQLREAEGSEGVRVGVLGIPRLALAP